MNDSTRLQLIGHPCKIETLKATPELTKHLQNEPRPSDVAIHEIASAARATVRCGYTRFAALGVSSQRRPPVRRCPDAKLTINIDQKREILEKNIYNN